LCADAVFADPPVFPDPDASAALFRAVVAGAPIIDDPRWTFEQRALAQNIATHPLHPDHRAGLQLFFQNDFAGAVALLEKAVVEGGGNSFCWRNLSEVYRILDRFDDAVAAARAAVSADPNDAFNYTDLASAFVHQRELDLALASARIAIELDPANPVAITTLAHTLFFHGDYAAAWKLPFWRVQLRWPAVPDAQRLWDGTPLEPGFFMGGTLLVIADLGFGDTLQWSRFLGWAAARCPEIALCCPPSLVEILRPLLPTSAQICRRWFDDDAPRFAKFVCFSELPKLARAEPGHPPFAPYIKADPARVVRWRQWLDESARRGSRRVGLCWSCSALVPYRSGNFQSAHRRIAAIRGAAAANTRVPRCQFRFFAMRRAGSREHDHPRSRRQATLMGRDRGVSRST
jgi:Tetratricopeptide repeat